MECVHKLIQHGADIESRNVRNEKEWKKAEIRKERFGGNCVTDSHFNVRLFGCGDVAICSGRCNLLIFFLSFLPFSSFHDHILIRGYFFFCVEILSLCLFVTLSLHIQSLTVILLVTDSFFPTFSPFPLLLKIHWIVHLMLCCVLWDVNLSFSRGYPSFLEC